MQLLFSHVELHYLHHGDPRQMTSSCGCKLYTQLLTWKPDDDDDDDDDDEIAWKTRQLVLSTAPKTWSNTDKDSINRKRSH